MSETQTQTVYADITKAVGRTPLVRINNLAKGVDATVLAKLEFANPAGSVKDRIGVSIVDAAEEAGALQPGGTIVEATSGNTGVALAFVGAARGYKVVIALPESMSKERRTLLRAYGAELILTPAAAGVQGAVDAANKIVAERPGAVLASQFTNAANPQIHYDTTGPEIWDDTAGDVDIFVAGVGTGGTLTGVGHYLKEQKPDVKIVAVQPAESPILTGKPAPHKIQGLAPNFVPDVLDREVYDEIIDVPGDTAIEWARRAAQEDGLLVGISAGANLYAAVELAKRPENAGKTIVTVLPDFGERYFSTVLYQDLVD